MKFEYKKICEHYNNGLCTNESYCESYDKCTYEDGSCGCLNEDCYIQELKERLKAIKALAKEHYMSPDEALENNNEVSDSKYLAKCAWHNLSVLILELIDDRV